MTDKRPFAIDVAIARIREAIRPFPQAALFALAEEGFSSPFELARCLSHLYPDPGCRHFVLRRIGCLPWRAHRSP